MSAEGGREYDERKLFVGGLSWDTNEDSLRNYFSKFGEVEEVAVKLDKQTNKPRGFGFVTFKDGSSIMNVLGKGQLHELDGKKIDPKPATAKYMAPPPAASKAESTKVFVGGIPHLVEGLTLEMLQQDLKDFFESSPYSNRAVSDVDIKLDPTTGRHRGFCFVTFVKPEDADEVCRTHFFQFKGKRIEAKKADPRQGRQSGGGYSAGGQMLSYPQQQWDGGAYAGSGSYGYGGGSEYGNYYPYSQTYQQQSGSSGGQMTGYENYGYSHGSSRGDTSAPSYGQGYQSYGYGTPQGGHAGYGTQHQQQQPNYYGHPTS